MSKNKHYISYQVNLNFMFVYVDKTNIKCLTILDSARYKSSYFFLPSDSVILYVEKQTLDFLPSEPEFYVCVCRKTNIEVL